MNKIKTLFFGSPVFAKNILQTLLKLEFLEIVGVVTQTDKEFGRKKELKSTEIKSFVLETDEWINQQTDERKLRQRIGAYPSFKYNFIIFKKDFENAENDSLTMYRVAIGYNEVQD